MHNRHIINELGDGEYIVLDDNVTEKCHRQLLLTCKSSGHEIMIIFQVAPDAYFCADYYFQSK